MDTLFAVTLLDPVMGRGGITILAAKDAEEAKGKVFMALKKLFGKVADTFSVDMMEAKEIGKGDQHVSYLRRGTQTFNEVVIY